MSSTQKDVLDAVDAAITAIGLSNVEQIVVRSRPGDEDRIEPGITISPIVEKEFAGTNQYEHVGIGVLVTMAINSNDSLDEHDIIGQWRQAIRRTFTHQRISGITTSCTTLVEPGSIYTSKLGTAQRDMDVDYLVIRAIVTETRL